MPSLPLISKGIPFRGHISLRWLLLAPVLLALIGCGSDPASHSPTTSTLDRIVLGAAADAEQAGDYAAATRHYATLYQDNRGSPVLVEGLARNLRKSGDLENSYALLREALPTLQPPASLLVEKGKVEIGLGRADLAVVTLQAAVAAAPLEWEPAAILAIALDRLSRFDEAANQYRAALALNETDNADIYNNYALSRALAGRIEEAKALLRKAVALPNASARVQQNLVFLEGFQQGKPTGLAQLRGPVRLPARRMAPAQPASPLLAIPPSAIPAPVIR